MVKSILRAVTPQHFLILLSLIFGLNLLDGLLTLLWVNTGVAEEVNPIMAAWLDLGPLYFLSIKVFLVTGLLFFVHRFYNNLLARALVLLVFFAYTMVLGIHFKIIMLIISHVP